MHCGQRGLTLADSDEVTCFEDIASHAMSLTDVDEIDKYIREANSKLPAEEQADSDAIQVAIDSVVEDVVKKYGAEVFQLKLEQVEVSEDQKENLSTAKELIKKYLMSAEPSEVDESQLLLTEKFEFKTVHSRILSKFYKEEKRRYDNKNRKSGSDDEDGYDMDSVSGRAKIVRDFADMLIVQQKRKKKPIKCVNDKLRMYKEGIYPDSDEVISFIKKDIVRIGLDNGINLTPGLIDQTIKLIELETLVKAEDCEPDNEYVVVLNNGLLDTKTWKFSEFDPEKVYFSKIPIDYDPNAKKPENFLKFIDTCFAGNEHQKLILQESFGYTLMKTYKYQVVFYLIGDGGNGKGSAMGILNMLLGTQNVTSFSLLQLTDGDNIDYNIAMMRGKHANICGDVGHTKIKNTEHIKKLSSNTDPVTGRHVREKPIQFINYAKLFFLMNRAPDINAHTTGDKRRIMLINFPNSFAEKSGEIKDIHKVIAEAGELPGILLWAIEGLKRLEKNKGFSDKRTVAQRAIEYDKKAHTMRYFVEECVYEDHGAIIPTAMLYQAYNGYRKRVGGAELGEKELKNEFLKECKEAGWNNVTSIQKRSNQLPEPMRDFVENIMGAKSSRCFFGISLVQEEPQTEITNFVKNEAPVVVTGNDADVYEMMMEDIGNDSACNIS
jgi:putative DNA primase/helicase